MKKIFIAFCMAAAVIFQVFGQQKPLLKGTVSDASGKPLSGATIVIGNTPTGTNTDGNGYFELPIPEGGMHVLVASYVGYVNSVDTVLADEIKTLNIVLKNDNLQLPEVVVRENFENARNRRETLSLEVIKKDFIFENNSGNLIKTIQKLPGVYSMDIGSGFSKPVIRGMGFNRVAVAENGIKQEGQQWGADHGLEIDQFNVEKLEIYKGPMSLQFGSDAIGGVLEIIPSTVSAENKIFGDVSIIGKSNNDLVGVSAMFGIKHNRWNARARFTEQHFGDYKIPADTIVYLTRKLPVYNRELKNTAGYDRSFSSTMGYSGRNLSSAITVSNVYQKTGFFPGSHGIPDLGRVQNDGDSRNIEMPNSNVNHLKIISNSSFKTDRWKTSLDVAFQNNHRQEWAQFHTHYDNQSAPKTDPDLEIDFRLKTYTGNIKIESTGDNKWKHQFGINTDYQENNIAGYNFLLPKFNRFTAGTFVIEKYALSEKIQLMGGMRFDYGQTSISAYKDQFLEQYLVKMNAYQPDEIAFFSQRSYGINRQFNDISWSTGLVYNPDRHQTYKINIGRSFRLPGANELASNGVHHGTFRHEMGDSSLVSENGYQLDIAYTFESERFYFSANPFASWFSKYIFLNPTGEWSVLPHAGQIYQYKQAQALIAGGEITANYGILRHLTLESGFEYVYMQNLTDGYPLPFSPPLSVINSITWHWHSHHKALEKLHLNLEHHFVASQQRIARNELTTAGNNLFGFSLNSYWKIRQSRFNVSLQVQNIFDTSYYNHLSFSRKLSIPEPGRNVQLILRIPVNE
jgi:iron complex outermembrane recepter protein